MLSCYSLSIKTKSCEVDFSSPMYKLCSTTSKYVQISTTFSFSLFFFLIFSLKDGKKKKRERYAWLEERKREREREQVVVACVACVACEMTTKERDLKTWQRCCRILVAVEAQSESPPAHKTTKMHTSCF